MTAGSGLSERWRKRWAVRRARDGKTTEETDESDRTDERKERVQGRGRASTESGTFVNRSHVAVWGGRQEAAVCAHTAGDTKTAWWMGVCRAGESCPMGRGRVWMEEDRTKNKQDRAV